MFGKNNESDMKNKNNEISNICYSFPKTTGELWLFV